MIKKDNIGRYWVQYGNVSDYERFTINYSILSFGHLIGPEDECSFDGFADKIKHAGYSMEEPKIAETYRVLRRYV